MANGNASSGGPRDEWHALADWVNEVSELVQRGVGLAGQIQRDWESMSRSDAPWTADTVTNEAIGTWEHLTPFLGDVIQSSIELGSWWLQNLWPTARADVAAWRSTADGTGLDAAGKYIDVSQRVVDRIARGDYESADFVDDWATVVGMSTKDAWRWAADARQGTTSTVDPTAHQADERATGLGPEPADEAGMR